MQPEVSLIERLADPSGVIEGMTMTHASLGPIVPMLCQVKKQDRRFPPTLKELVSESVAAYLDAHTHLCDVSNLHEKVIDEVEKSLIEIVLDRVGGNQLKATSILGINRNTLRHKLKVYGLSAKKPKTSNVL